MLRLRSLLCPVVLLIACRSTVKSSESVGLEPMEAKSSDTLPMLSLGDSFACLGHPSAPIQCRSLRPEASKSGDRRLPPAWQRLRFDGGTPEFRFMGSKSMLSCGLPAKSSGFDNQITCWSVDPVNQNMSDKDVKVYRMSSAPKLKSLALLKESMCLLQSDGAVLCAAWPNFETDLREKPSLDFSPMRNVSRIAELHSGDRFACALRADTGAIWCWGDNTQSQLGLGTESKREAEAVAIAGFSGSAIALDLGARHACAINGSGEVLCWGDNSDWQLGAETNADSGVHGSSAIPLLVRGLPAKAQSLALGDRHSCALLVDSSVWCWGGAGRLGADSGDGNSLIPLKVKLPVAALRIVAGAHHTCAQLGMGDTFCWGRAMAPAKGQETEGLYPEVLPKQ